MPAEVLRPDVLILGGGVTGLFCCARLLAAGHSCLLLDVARLGSGQSIAAQGIIHGGMKYALTGQASRASAAIAEMPPRWKAMLGISGQWQPGLPRQVASTAELDLSAVEVLSADTCLWTVPGAVSGLVSRFAAKAASKVLRTAVRPWAIGARPEVFDGVTGIDVYQVEEPVVDAASLLQQLAACCQRITAGCIRSCAASDLAVGLDAHGPHVRVGQTASEPRISIRPRLLFCAAGAGNAQLARALGSAVQMQLRPLHMVYARGSAVVLPELFGHCLGPSNLPRLTVTSRYDRAANQRVWAVGGAIAEQGTQRTPEQQIAAAKAEVAACLRWTGAHQSAAIEWTTALWNRAEGCSPDGARPDEPVLTRCAGDRVVIAWPTKLAFAPRVADEVCAMFSALPGPIASTDERAPDVGRDLAAWSTLAGAEVARPPG